MYKGNYDLNKKLVDRKRGNSKNKSQHPLFENYDPDNTLLNVIILQQIILISMCIGSEKHE